MDLKPHLDSMNKRFDSLVHELSSPDIAANSARFQQLRREHARTMPIIEKYQRYLKLLAEQKDLQSLKELSDGEMRKMAEDDLASITPQIATLESDLRLALLPRDPNEDRNVILEIRAGTGGDEASLFAADLMRMYQRNVEKHKWTLEALEASVSERGGYKEVIVQISGANVWKHFKYERGVHRVQRVPITEASGRIHTSTATVAVLPEAEEVDFKIDPNDLRIDTFRASGAGGQHINKTDSAIRITHIPTGFFVACQEERSQIKNRAKAMKLLRSRLLEMAQEKQAREISLERKSQVGTGERSEKIRTYNFPQDRVTDHRINVNLHNLPGVLDGELDDLILALQKDEQASQLEALSLSLENRHA